MNTSTVNMPTKIGAPINIDIFYDFRSPYAYFAAHRMSLPEFQTSREILWKWRPVSIDMLLNLQAKREPLADYVDPLPPAKRQHLIADVTRLARFYNAPLRPPKPPRQDPTLALSVATLLSEETIPHDKFRSAVFRALWEEQRDIAQKEVVASCLGSLPEELIDQANSQKARNTLIANTEAAYKKGVFGVPTFVHKENIFFGADRLDLLLASLAWS